MQFYRQKPILNYIADFYCPSANLVIECGGSQHYTDEGLEADRMRDKALAQLGLEVLKFDDLLLNNEFYSGYYLFDIFLIFGNILLKHHALF